MVLQPVTDHGITLPSRFGPLVLLWREGATGPRVVRILLSRPGDPAPQRCARECPRWLPAKGRAPARVAHLGRRLQAFLEGEDLAFALEEVALELCPPFQRRVLRAEHAIARGWVSSYGLIARRIGSPRAARAVGTALARNPFPLVVPCHRAIRSDGRLGDYQGGQAMKRALLEREGIRVGPDGRVRGARIRYAGRRDARDLGSAVD